MGTCSGRPEEIGIVIYPGAQLAAVHGLTDLFCIAGKFAAQAQGNNGSSLHVTHWSYVGRGSQDLQCIYSSDPRTPARPSALILPPTLTDLPDANTSSGIALWLVAQHEHGVKLVSVCSGIFLVARTGLLDGRLVSTHHSCAQTLMDQFPRIVVDANQRIIEYPGILTAGGFLAWIDVGLALVAELLGDSVREKTAQFILSDRPVDEATYLPGFALPSRIQTSPCAGLKNSFISGTDETYLWP